MPSKEDMLKSVGEMLQNNWNMLTNSFLKKETPAETIEDRWKLDFEERGFEEEFEELKTKFEVIREKEIRDLAYSLWEDAGRPDGCSDEFWRQAEERLNV